MADKGMDSGMDLFAAAETSGFSSSTDSGAAGGSMKPFEPLAKRMRPRNFQEFVGQQEAVGSVFHKLNAVAAGIQDIRQIVKEADEQRRYYQKHTIVFIDEIHRFNKSQQDVLLPYVEDGRLILIGATTENPFFEVNHALLSRVRIVRLYQLNDGQLVKILRQALQDTERGLGSQALQVTDEVLLSIAQMAGGDARMALNILEGAASMLPLSGGEITMDMVQEILGQKVQRYDKKGDNHYDTVSAFIKSMRGSDPDAALHYLARMLAAGEDVKFIARRIVICASEDVGNADPMALVVAMNAANAVQFIGLPEAQITLGQAVTYIASAPKSNAACEGIFAALRDVKSRNCGAVPIHLRDAHYKGAAKLGHGVDYIYPHDYPGHFTRQQYLPKELSSAHYYAPSGNGAEKRLSEYLHQCWPERF